MSKSEASNSTTALATGSVQVPHDDGFDYADGGSSSIIKGRGKLAFGNDAKWTLHDELIASTREFIVVEHKRFVQEWGLEDGAPPISTRELRPDEFFPDVERMNEETPKERWRMSFGQLKGPHEAVHALYMVEQETMAGYTYLTSTKGGHKAVRELTEAICRARLLGTANLFPVVTLGNTFMPTNYGGRQRPQLNVVRWIEIGRSAASAVPQQPVAQVEAPKAKSTKPKNDDLNDSVPF